MRPLLMCCFIICAAIMSPWSSVAAATSAKVDTLVFQRIFLYVVDDDPTTRTRRLYFDGKGGNFRVDTDSIITRVDPDEPIGRVFVRYVACSELPAELAKFRSWDWEKAMKGRYRPKSGEETVRPSVRVTIMFHDEAEYNQYLQGDDWPLATPANMPIRGRIIYAPKGFTRSEMSDSITTKEGSNAR